MKKTAICIMVVAMALAVNIMFAQTSFAQGEKGQAAGSESSVGAWTFYIPHQLDTALTGNEAIVVESGKVKKVGNMPSIKDGLQMEFVTDQGNDYVVYMGPKWFVNNQKLKFRAGDNVEVRGKKVGSAIIATEISKGDWTMKFRNEEDGMPTWQCCFPREVKKLQ
ncbi:MAG: hypothetical protein ACLP9S_13710 [Syntrophales bacterium]|jgi:hypothetical protein